LFGYEASAITTTISAGRLLMAERRLLTLDEAAITARSRELAAACGRAPLRDIAPVFLVHLSCYVRMRADMRIDILTLFRVCFWGRCKRAS
jgi:hypothetical protein